MVDADADAPALEAREPSTEDLACDARVRRLLGTTDA